MKKDKRKIDKEIYKQLLIFVLGGIILGGIVSTFLLYAFCLMLSFQLSLPMQIILGFLLGGGTTGVFIGASIKDSLKNNSYEEEIEYEEYVLDAGEEIEDELIQEDVRSLKIVKGSGSNYGYEFKSNERPKLEFLNPEDKQTSKKDNKKDSQK